MRTLKVAGAALNQTPLDWDGNLAHILLAIQQAIDSEVSILCLPELCISGYGCEDAFYAEATRRRSIESLLKIVPQTLDLAVCVGLPIFHQNGLYNVNCLIANGEILGFSCKQFLANEGIHYEPRWFKPWPAGKVSDIEIAGLRYPFGDICYALGDLIVGFEICEDAWAPNRPGSRLAETGADLILNPSASHFAFEKFEVRKRFVTEGSRSFSCAYVYANHLGNESGRAIYDGGTLVANAGHLLESGPRFSFKDVLITSATVDLELGRLSRARRAKSSEELKPNEVHLVRSKPKSWAPPITGDKQRAYSIKSSWENGQNLKEEEFARAVSLALFDYLRKSQAQGFVLSLSGGADSSAVACLVRFSLTLALKELGADGLVAKLGYCLDHSIATDLEKVCAQLLTTVYQSSENSGEVTTKAAAAVASAVGASHLNISIAEPVKTYTALVEKALGRKLSWESDDVALQNIQARSRGPSVWMIANIKKALLLATSNRSEVAVGYATMDGDTCGSISPIAGIDKAFLRRWLRWVERVGPEGLGAIPALALVNNQEPTAELRPGKQTDETDLMPYEALEYIERAAIRDKKDPAEILEALKTQFASTPQPERLRWVRLFFTLWSKSQWKRERYAPSFHLDDESLDPKTWCRFPILSGGYRKELSELS